MATDMTVIRRTTTIPKLGTLIPVPEPDLTGAQMIQRARDMREALRARQDECEAGGEMPAETNRDFIKAGFYRTVQPRRFGGYEFDVPTFQRVMMEVARGCPASGWVLALTAGHPMMLAAFPEQAQIEAYGADGEFRAPLAGSPTIAAVVDGGYRVSGAWDYCSGCDIATHFIGSARAGRPDPSEHPGPILILFDRKDFSIVDNWQMVGMQGTGSRRVVVEEMFVPAHRTLGRLLWGDDIEPQRGVIDNAMYYGRKPCFLVAEATAVAVGTARGALDLYEDLLRVKPLMFPPFKPRHQDQEYQEHFGTAHALVDTAEAAMLKAGENYMEACRRYTEEGVPFSDETDRRLLLVLQQCVRLAWEAVDLMFSTAGTSAGRRESKLARYFRDLAVMRTHITLQSGRTAPNFARLHFGLPPLSPM